MFSRSRSPIETVPTSTSRPKSLPWRTRVIRNWNPPGPQAYAFRQSNAFVRGLMGPIGSGKSSCGVIEILSRAAEQRKGPSGKRRSRWAVIRNSYPELKSTTLKTWADWIPPTVGKITYGAPITHRIETSELDIEVFFLALDRDEDVKKLLSLELTGAWVEEAREVPRVIFDALTGRVGRFPSASAEGCTWYGIICTTNPPDTEHWWFKLFEVDRPEGFELFKQ